MHRWPKHRSDAVSSDEDAVLAEAPPEQRGQVALFTWPRPREYYASGQHRIDANCLIPSDVSRRDLLATFEDVMGHWQDVTCVLIAMEPHARMTPNGRAREQHYHVAFKMTKSFACRTIATRLKDKGVHGFMSRNLKGWMQYAEYLLCETPRKLAHQRDPSPLLWPDTSGRGIQNLRTLIEKSRKTAIKQDAEARGLQHTARPAQKKRRGLEYHELVQLVVENEIHREQDWWMHARRLQQERGENVMFNYYDRVKNQPDGIQRTIDNAWKHHAAASGKPFFTTYPLNTTCRFDIHRFHLTADMIKWLAVEHKGKTLVLEGPGGLGKTQLAHALLHRLCGAYFVCDNFDMTNKCHWTGREGILFDDVDMRDRTIDECKGMLDLELNRGVRCRYADGILPTGTPRVFCTNHTITDFFPPQYVLPAHKWAIDRRLTWLKVVKDLRLHRPHQPENDEYHHFREEEALIREEYYAAERSRQQAAQVLALLPAQVESPGGRNQFEP